MTFYSVLVFTHITAAFFLFGGLLLEMVVIGFLRRNPDLAGFRAWGRIFSLAPRLYGPALGILLLSGGYLGAQMSAWAQGWVRVSFVTLFVIGAIGSVTSRRFWTIRRLLDEASDASATTLAARLNDPVLIASVRMRIALVFGIGRRLVDGADVGNGDACDDADDRYHDQHFDEGESSGGV